LPARSCLIDGEAIVSDDNGLSVFDLIRNYRRGHVATLCAFDLLELNGQDFRAQRKAALKMLLRRATEHSIILQLRLSLGD
jgi:ATP-dependent DNA ligase